MPNYKKPSTPLNELNPDSMSEWDAYWIGIEDEAIEKLSMEEFNKLGGLGSDDMEAYLTSYIEKSEAAENHKS